MQKEYYNYLVGGKVPLKGIVSGCNNVLGPLVVTQVEGLVPEDSDEVLEVLGDLSCWQQHLESYRTNV